MRIQRRSLPFRTGALGLVLVGLLTTGSGDAWHPHDCPHHAPGALGAAADGVPARVGGAALTGPGRGPCTCMGSCYASADGYVPGPGPCVGDLVVPPPAAVFAPREGLRLSPSLLPYVLAWANPPPSSFRTSAI